MLQKRDIFLLDGLGTSVNVQVFIVFSCQEKRWLARIETTCFHLFHVTHPSRSHFRYGDVPGPWSNTRLKKFLHVKVPSMKIDYVIVAREKVVKL